MIIFLLQFSYFCQDPYRRTTVVIVKKGFYIWAKFHKLVTMITAQIPGFGSIELKYLVSDYSGTLAVDGRLVVGVREKLIQLSESLEIFIVTADSYGYAEDELKEVKCKVHRLTESHEAKQKERFIRKLGAEHVFAMGNGNNDWLMLKRARIGAAVCLSEGVSTEALKSADIFLHSGLETLNLLLNTRRLIASLRF